MMLNYWTHQGFIIHFEGYGLLFKIEIDLNTWGFGFGIRNTHYAVWLNSHFFALQLEWALSKDLFNKEVEND